jgi:hypothetical protein
VEVGAPNRAGFAASDDGFAAFEPKSEPPYGPKPDAVPKSGLSAEPAAGDAPKMLPVLA